MICSWQALLGQDQIRESKHSTKRPGTRPAFRLPVGRSARANALFQNKPAFRCVMVDVTESFRRIVMPYVTAGKLAY